MSRVAGAVSTALCVLSLATPLRAADAPLLEQARLFASDGTAGDLFGLGVAVDGDAIVVGTGGDDVDGKVDQGSAYVFVKPATGWGGAPVASARLLASDGLAGDLFGNFVAIDGDTIIVGAQSANGDRGAAYVFVKPAAGWSGTLTQTTRLVASDGLPNEQFGASVAADGGVVVVGASWHNSFRGAGYVYVRPAAGWPAGTIVQNAKLLNTDGAVGFGIGDVLGETSAIQGDTIVLGAFGEDFGGIDAGAAYVYVKPAAGWSGTLTQRARLVAAGVNTNDHLGTAVALHGDTVVTGASEDDIGTGIDHGSAYVFVKPAAGWSGTVTQAARLVASDPVADARLGASARLDAEGVLVGALGGVPGQAAGTGAVYRYATPPAGWSGTLTETEKLIASDGAAGDEFGNRLALDGDILVVGARRDDVGASVNQGSAYVFVRAAQPSSLVLTPDTAENPVGTSHTLTATVTNVAGGAVAGVTVVFDVSGAVTTVGTCVTAPAGTCDFTYTGPTAPGSDSIGAFADTDGDGLQDPDEPGGAASKDWVAGPPAALALTPATAENPVGTSHTVTAAVADAYGNAVAPTTVRFTVTGASSVSGACVTAIDGSCAFTYTGPTAPGLDAIAAFADSDGDGAPGPGEPAAAAAKTWMPAAPSAMTLTPPAATNPVGTEHCVEAAVRDAFGNANAGVTVRFVVAGSVDATGTDVTDADGKASFCYVGPEMPGADEIGAHADTDGDGAVDAGEPLAAATKSWLLPESTPGQATGGGHFVPTPGGEEVAFGFNAGSDGTTVEGRCNIIDRARGARVKCLDATWFSIAGGHAVVFGNATVNGMATTYRIDAFDGGEPGAGADAFTIVTAGGYAAGGPLTRGNVQVR